MSNSKVSFGKVFWPSLVAFLVAGILVILFVSTVVSGLIVSAVGGDDKVDDSPILHLTLNGALKDQSASKLDVYSMNVSRSFGLSEILYGLNKAKSDDKIKGVFIELKAADCGYSTASELRSAIQKFEKESGKFVVAYLSGEYVSQKVYYVSSSASEVYGFPSSNFQFTGIGSEVMFYKNLLDKIGVEMQVIRGKNNDFKSAVEPFFRTEMSDSSRLQMNTYIHSIWSSMLSDISQKRGVSVAKLNEYANDLTITSCKDAQSKNLIDKTMYRDEVMELLAKKIGVKVEDLKLKSFEKYAQSKFNQDQVLTQSKKDGAIAVILAEGDITVDGSGLSSKATCKNIREAVADKNVKIIVLRVNSPGGSALASDEIAREVALANKSKKVIVSMGDLAASGGYYISALADRIFANPMTITGSIGVFGTIPYTGKVLEDKLGITFDRVQTNKSSVLSTNRKLSEGEIAKIQKEVDVIYSDFLSIVAKGRGMTPEQVNVYARGRVWTGKDALRIGLVDELGDIQAAIKYAAKKADVEASNILIWPKQKESTIDVLLNNIKDSEESVLMTSKLPSELLNYYDKIKKLESYTGIQARMPFEITLY